MEFLAQDHPLLVHFPIAFFFLYLIFESSGIIFKKEYLLKSAIIILALGVIGSVESVLTGNQAAELLKVQGNLTSEISEAIEDIASYCVFGTIVRNTSDTSLYYSVADWYAETADGVKHTFKTKTQWLDEWRKMSIRYPWTILPSEQTFEIGDWSQGFTTIKLPREEPFDLIYSWNLDGEKKLGKIKKIRCAPISLQNK